MMKKLILFIPYLFLFTTLFGQFETDTIKIEQSYELTKSKPIKIQSGQIVISQANNIYLVNELRFNYYEQLRSILSDSIDFAMDDLILKYEKALKDNDYQYNLLLNNCEEQSRLYQKHTEEVKSSIALTSNTLILTQQSLTNANQSIKEANELMRASKAQRTWQKIGIAGGGVAIGLVLGLLVN